ncbi:dUTP diphosphatase [Patescibacteria group bacterium]|nr:dUTP diphosphatase [Patescibacteria group bacterium]
MHVTIRRIDTELPLPKYETAGAVAFDLICRTTTTIAPKTVALLPSNVVVVVPEGYALLLNSRSSTARKRGLLVPLGIIDQDYCGQDDELLLQVLNFSDAPVTIERGERVGQALLVKIERAKWNEVTELSAPSRGGFGTTGV